ncbi:MAG: hypothetical protein L0Y68_09910 [Candidatus Dadabacteria bacterium]|nr:hypothetical protein [Candidatus Dadabacteria bacterium]
MKTFNFSPYSIALFCIFILSCSVPIQRVEKSPQQVSERPIYVSIEIKKIALVPFSSDTEVTPGKEQYVTDVLYNELISKILKVNIVPLESSTSEFTRVEAEYPELPDREVALKVGNNLGAQAVIIGRIVAYSEREGGELGVSSPASVAFSVDLLSTANGEKIWENYFAETQRPLFENVVEVGKFFKRKGRWISADELAKEGVIEVVDELNKFLEQR